MFQQFPRLVGSPAVVAVDHVTTSARVRSSGHVIDSSVTKHENNKTGVLCLSALITYTSFTRYEQAFTCMQSLLYMKRKKRCDICILELSLVLSE